VSTIPVALPTGHGSQANLVVFLLCSLNDQIKDTVAYWKEIKDDVDFEDHFDALRKIVKVY
jgi:hypothetical protein